MYFIQPHKKISSLAPTCGSELGVIPSHSSLHTHTLCSLKPDLYGPHSTGFGLIGILQGRNSKHQNQPQTPKLHMCLPRTLFTPSLTGSPQISAQTNCSELQTDKNKSGWLQVCVSLEQPGPQHNHREDIRYQGSMLTAFHTGIIFKWFEQITLKKNPD